MIDHDKTIESYKKNLALHKDEKRRCMEEYDKLSQWTQQQLIEREKQMQAIREQIEQANCSQNNVKLEAEQVTEFFIVFLLNCFKSTSTLLSNAVNFSRV